MPKTLRNIAYELAKEAKDLWLMPDHDCNSGPIGQERYIIHYIHECEGCLAQLLMIALRKASRR